MSTNTLRSLKDILDECSWNDDTFEKRRVPPHQVLLQDDPIALSWASYHVWIKFPARRWASLNDVEAHEHDRVIAADTRRYYRDRFALQVLKGKELTKFQHSLYELITEERPLMSDQVGMVMKLPYFYVEDTAQDEIFAQTQPVTGSHLNGHVGTIRPVTTYLMSRRSNESYCYWFEDDLGHPVCWAVSTQNALRSVVESLYRRDRPTEIRANWHVQGRSSDRSQHYYHLANVELV
jgi:hypothetical protein